MPYLRKIEALPPITYLMFLRLFIKVLLADEEAADQVWELLDAGLISDGLAAWASCIIAGVGVKRS